jgi:hypothetical protein
VLGKNIVADPETWSHGEMVGIFGRIEHGPRYSIVSAWRANSGHHSARIVLALTASAD